MRCGKSTLTGILLILNTHFLPAQRVLYSPYIDDRFMLRYEVAGKSGDFYWLQKENRRKVNKHHPDPWNYMDRSFEIYDSRMNLINIVQSPAITDSTIKEYLVPGDKYFDDLLILSGPKKTWLSVMRYEPDGFRNDSKVVSSLPFRESGSSFLLARSEDKNRILLLAFESVSGSAPRLHAVLFDQNWKQLSYTKYEHPFISQPYIQDDFTGYPMEHFSNAPVKLANNGQWLMASPSRKNNNYLLFHFCQDDNSFSFKEIVLPEASSMEDLSLSIDNDKGEAFAGILSVFRYNTLKNVQVTHYSLMEQRFDFDSSYRFNTLASGKIKDENLAKESFISVPGMGFMLLKEYGRPSAQLNLNDDYNDFQWDPDFIFANHIMNNSAGSYVNKHGYTRYNQLGGTKGSYERGDLSLFYFPARTHDSCWSGMLSKEQVTEFNAPYLSYVVIPLRDKLFFLYNSIIRNDAPFGNTTILDQRGNLLTDEEGITFWNFNNNLVFQQSRQISENEIAIPYERNQRKGFAIIRL